MAIVARIQIPHASQDDHDRLQAAIEARFAAAGGPPDGLMVHLGFPDGQGIVLVEAWRTEDLFQAYRAEPLAEALAEVGLAATEPEIAEAWSIARP